MTDGTWMLMRPVVAGCCAYESLLDCTLGLADLARMNEAMDVDSENQYRAIKASEKNGS